MRWGSLSPASEPGPNLCVLVGRVFLAKRQPTLVIRVYWGVLHPGEGNHETAARRRVGSVSARLVRITAPAVCDVTNAAGYWLLVNDVLEAGAIDPDERLNRFWTPRAPL